MKKHKWAGVMFVVILFAVFPFYSTAVTADYGSDSVFAAGSGSRALAMGGAFTAISDDTSGIYYNPAGLINAKKQQLSLNHFPMLLGTFYNSASYVQPLLDFGSVGAALYRVYSGDIMTYDSSDVAGDTTVFEEYKATISYARQVTEHLSAGVNVNMFSFSMFDVSGMGFGADAGLLYEPFDFLAIGLACHNIIRPEIQLSGSKDVLPQIYSAGVLFKLEIKPVGIKLAADVSRNELINSFKYRAGLELKTFGIIALRAGLNDGQINAGAGLELFGAQLDYSYIMDDYFGGMSRFSLSYNFGLTLEQQKKSNEAALKEHVKKMVQLEFAKKEQDKAKIYLDKALQYYKEGRYQDAMDEADKALAWARDYKDADKLKQMIAKKLVMIYYRSAVRSFEKGDLVSALESFKNVSAMDPDYGEARSYIERINRNMEMKSGARAMFAKGVEAYVNKDYDGAMDFFSKALAIEPDNTVIRTYITKTRGQMRRAGGGRLLTDDQAQQVKKLYYYGLKLYTAGDLKGAEKAWKEALEVNPDDIKVLKSIERAQDELSELQKRGIK